MFNFTDEAETQQCRHVYEKQVKITERRFTGKLISRLLAQLVFEVVYVFSKRTHSEHTEQYSTKCIELRANRTNSCLPPANVIRFKSAFASLLTCVVE